MKLVSASLLLHLLLIFLCQQTVRSEEEIDDATESPEGEDKDGEDKSEVKGSTNEKDENDKDKSETTKSPKNRYGAKSECIDIYSDKCKPSKCYGTGYLYCMKTCFDCDGLKFAKFKEDYFSSACIDAYPKYLCESWAAQDNLKYGCRGKRSSVARGCRKTCKNCKPEEP